MKKQISIKKMVSETAQTLDKIAQIVLLGIMLFIVINVLMRGLLSKPITGSYDLVSLFIVIVVALALANCAVENGHIAIDFIVERYLSFIQGPIDIIKNTISLIFISLFTYNIGKYAYAAAIAGEKSDTLKISFYPFIYVVSFGYLFLCLVLLVDLLDTVEDVLRR